MTKFRGLGLATITALVLGGCDAISGTSAGCLSPKGQEVVIGLIRDDIEKSISRSLDGNSEIRVPLANIRASIANIGFTLEDVRTSKEDPDSTKKFCAATLKAVVPMSMINDAERSFELMGSVPLNDVVERNGGERSANTVEIPLDFTLQPTDDRKSIFGEIETPEAITSLFSDLVGAQILKTRIERAKADEAQAEAERVRLEAEAQKAERDAVLGEAKSRFELSVQQINAVWQSLPTETREAMTPQQVAFNRRKATACRLEASQYSTDPTEREATRLNCETQLMNSRATELNRYVIYDE